MSRKYTIFGIDVCKTALLKTLQIGPGRITVALKKLSNEKFVDERGKAICGWNKFPSAKREEVKNHISSFPKYVSHYTRNQTKSKFLHSSLNLGIMYRLYKEKFQNPVSKSFYKKVFYEDFNLRFKVAKKDTCKKCDYCFVKSKTAVGIDRQVNDEWHKSHVDRADFLRKKMNDDLERAKIDDEIETLTFDLQKVLVLPKVPTNIVYYLRQLNLYNFGIHVGSTNQGIFNVWLEHEASKGTQEVGSCLRKYIMSISHPVKKLLLWSDSCGGQNRSIKLVLMLMHTLQNHPSLETISLRFLESGHSFLPNDSDFGDMECKLKTNERVFTDEKYMQIMRDCRINNKFQVNRMSPNVDFHSVDKLLQYTTNRKKDSNKTKVSWMETHEIVMEKSNPLTIKMKKIIDGESQSVNLVKKGCDANGFKDIKLELLWPEGRPLSQEKIKDLETMMYLVDDDAKPFYDFLKNIRAEEFVDDLEGFGQAIDFDLEFQDE
ncbi:uncharacterized protein LOC119067135 [Bradysia coprophila]|uniref:uncharacterized protein LOC119067135 n=1 Tax=Bradysia coprophila TaxID=38358 RepID=UPI00187DA8E2|nr:uncharacterized protein LOC119067135 [Bradysia coprophila]